MKVPKMPARQPTDGSVRVTMQEQSDGTEVIYMMASRKDGDVEHHSSLTCSEYNAWRLFAMLAMFFDIPLPKRVHKAISMGDGPFSYVQTAMDGGVKIEGTVAPDGMHAGTISVAQDGTLGDRIARNMYAKEMAKKLGVKDGEE